MLLYLSNVISIVEELSNAYILLENSYKSIDRSNLYDTLTSSQKLISDLYSDNIYKEILNCVESKESSLFIDNLFLISNATALNILNSLNTANLNKNRNLSDFYFSLGLNYLEMILCTINRIIYVIIDKNALTGIRTGGFKNEKLRVLQSYRENLMKNKKYQNLVEIKKALKIFLRYFADFEELKSNDHITYVKNAHVEILSYDTDLFRWYAYIERINREILFLISDLSNENEIIDFIRKINGDEYKLDKKECSSVVEYLNKNSVPVTKKTFFFDLLDEIVFTGKNISNDKKFTEINKMSVETNTNAAGFSIYLIIIIVICLISIIAAYIIYRYKYK